MAYDPKKDLAKGSVFKNLAKNKYTHVLVRARVKNDLEALRTVVPNVIVVEDKVADYAFRAVITRRNWKKFLNAATDDMDYDSHFKEVMRDGDKLQGGKRYSAVMKVWTAMVDLQPYGAWSGASYSSATGKSTYSSTYDKNFDVDGWWAAHGDGYPLDADAPDEDVAVAPEEEDDSPLSINDIKRFILEENKSYPDFLSEKEVARADDDGFELWVRVVEMRKKLGAASFHLSEILLDDLIADIKADAAEEEEAVK